MISIKTGGITWELQQSAVPKPHLLCHCGELAVYSGYYTANDIVTRLDESFEFWMCKQGHILTRFKRGQLGAK